MTIEYYRYILWYIDMIDINIYIYDLINVEIYG